MTMLLSVFSSAVWSTAVCGFVRSVVGTLYTGYRCSRLAGSDILENIAKVGHRTFCVSLYMHVESERSYTSPVCILAEGTVITTTIPAGNHVQDRSVYQQAFN